MDRQRVGPVSTADYLRAVRQHGEMADLALMLTYHPDEVALTADRAMRSELVRYNDSGKFVISGKGNEYLTTVPKPPKRKRTRRRR